MAADAPSSWWKLDDLTTTAVDAQAVANGTYSGTYTQGAAPIVSNSDTAAATFAGGRVAVSDVYDFVGVAFTVEFWIRPDLSLNPTTYKRVVGKEATGTNTPGWLLTCQSTADASNPSRFRFERRNTAVGVINAVTGTGPAITGQTYHVVVTFDLATLRLYVNGAEVSNEAIATANEDTTGLVGFMARGADGASAMGGTLQHVTLYSGKALSVARVVEHYIVGRTAPTYAPHGMPVA